MVFEAGVSLAGEGLSLVSAIFQKQVSITDGKETVYLEATEDEQQKLAVSITSKPVTDRGSAVDYISRENEPLTLTGLIANRNLDPRRDPVGLAAGHLAAFAPSITSTLAAGLSVANKFGLLGKDAIDKKLETLNKWRLNGTYLDVLGLRLNAKYYSFEGDDYKFLLQEISPAYNSDFGDGVGVTLSFEHIVVIGATNIQKQGGKLKDKILGGLKAGFVNPFA